MRPIELLSTLFREDILFTTEEIDGVETLQPWGNETVLEIYRDEILKNEKGILELLNTPVDREDLLLVQSKMAGHFRDVVWRLDGKKPLSENSAPLIVAAQRKIEKEGVPLKELFRHSVEYRLLLEHWAEEP